MAGGVHLPHRRQKTCKTLSSDYGPPPDGWAGQRLTPETAQAANDQETCAFTRAQVLHGAEYCARGPDVWAMGVSLYVLLVGAHTFWWPLISESSSNESDPVSRLDSMPYDSPLTA